MKDQLISFETAKLAKEKGFSSKPEGYVEGYQKNGKLFTYRSSKRDGYLHEYSEDYEASTQSLLQRWLREEHNIDIIIEPNIRFSGTSYSFKREIIYKWIVRKDMEYSKLGGIKNTYEEALEEGLQQALKLIKS